MSLEDALGRFHLHERCLRALALRLSCGNAFAADDLVQETAMRVAKIAHGGGKIPSPEGESGFLKWLKGVLRNVRHEGLRASGRRTERERHVAESFARVEGESAGEAAAKNEQRRIIEALLEEAEPDVRNLMLLRYREGLRLNEIAQGEGVPAATVRARHARGLARLRATLDRRFGAGQWSAAMLVLARDAAEWAAVKSWADRAAGGARGGAATGIATGIARFGLPFAAVAALALTAVVMRTAPTDERRDDAPPAAVRVAEVDLAHAVGESVLPERNDDDAPASDARPSLAVDEPTQTSDTKLKDHTVEPVEPVDHVEPIEPIKPDARSGPVAPTPPVAADSRHVAPKRPAPPPLAADRAAPPPDPEDGPGTNARTPAPLVAKTTADAPDHTKGALASASYAFPAADESEPAATLSIQYGPRKFDDDGAAWLKRKSCDDFGAGGWTRAVFSAPMTLGTKTVVEVPAGEYFVYLDRRSFEGAKLVLVDTLDQPEANAEQTDAVTPRFVAKLTEGPREGTSADLDVRFQKPDDNAAHDGAVHLVVAFGGGKPGVDGKQWRVKVRPVGETPVATKVGGANESEEERHARALKNKKDRAGAEAAAKQAKRDGAAAEDATKARAAGTAAKTGVAEARAALVAAKRACLSAAAADTVQARIVECYPTNFVADNAVRVERLGRYLRKLRATEKTLRAVGERAAAEHVHGAFGLLSAHSDRTAIE